MDETREKMSLKEWAEKIAAKYDIFPQTVLEIRKNLVGKQKRNRRERTESFLELYFEGRNNDEC